MASNYQSLLDNHTISYLGKIKFTLNSNMS